MYSVKEIKMEIGESIDLFIEENDEVKNISRIEFEKLKPQKQTEVLLDSLMVLHTNLKEDLRSIWERLDRIEE